MATQFGITTPDPSAPVSGGAAAMQTMAQQIGPRLPAKIVRGSWAYGALAVAGSQSTVVNLPAGFTVAPWVGGNADNARVTVAFIPNGTASFTVSVLNSSGGAAPGGTVSWIAIQEPPTV
jgi:hypothetical protein